jgi:DNA-binding response OmpR family regulator
MTPTILLAMPDPVWCIRLRRALERRGADVRIAATARQAEAALSWPAPDLVVLQSSLGRSATLLHRVLCLDIRVVRADPPLDLRDVIANVTDALPASRRLDESGPVILCVDDDPLCLRALERVLTRHGYRVAAFEDADRALEEAPRLEPDLAILDVAMPDVDGPNLAASLRHVLDSVPIVALSALPPEEQSAFDRYLTKPCAPEDLLDAVHLLVEK